MATIWRALIVLTVATIGAPGLAQDWRPVPIARPYQPIVPAGYLQTQDPKPPYEPGTAPPSTVQPAQPGTTTIVPPGTQLPPVMGSDFGVDAHGNPVYGNAYGGQPSWMACDGCGRHGCRRRRCHTGSGGWYASADALWLKRSRPNNHPLTVLRSSNGYVLETDDLRFDLEAGTRLTLGRHFGPTTAIEGTYFGFHDWDSAVSTPPETATAYDPYWAGASAGSSGFNDAARHVANYSSELWNWELGLRRWLNPDSSVMAGFRYIGYEEELVFASRRDNGDRGTYNINTRNDLIGFQIGGEHGHTTPWQRLRISFFGKAGVFFNPHEQRSLFYGGPAGAGDVDNIRGNDSVGLASALEFGVTFTLRLTDHFSMRAGYNSVYLTGLALAPDQLDPDPRLSNARTAVNDRGSLHLHGPFVGGEILLK